MLMPVSAPYVNSKAPTILDMRPIIRPDKAEFNMLSYPALNYLVSSCLDICAWV